MLRQKSRFVDVIKPSVRLVVSLIILAIIGSITISVLEAIPSGSVPAAALTEMSVGMIAIVLMLLFGEEIASSIRSTFRANPEFFSITFSMIQVLAVVLGYFTFDRIFQFVFTEWFWTYDPVFLALALIPASKAGATMVRSIDKWIDRKN